MQTRRGRNARQRSGRPDYLNARDAFAVSRRGPTQSLLISTLFMDPIADDSVSAFEQLRERVRARAPQIPRLTQRIVTTPGALAPPAWFDAELFHLEYHIQARRVAGGGMSELLHAIEHATQPLDLRLPPWRIHVVEGFDDGKWAIIVQVHHAVGDGTACIALFGALLLDLDFLAPPEALQPKVFAPPALRLLRPGLAWRGRSLTQRSRCALNVIRSRSSARGAARDVARLATLLWRESRNKYRPAGINVRPSGDWVCRLTSRPLDEVRLLARSIPGATVNTVYLAAVAHAIDGALRAEGMPLQAPLKIGVPKNLRQDTARVFVDSSTQTGNLVVTAPWSQDDPLQLLGAITDRLRHALACDEPGTRAMLGKGGAVQKWPLKWNVTATLMHGPPCAPDSLGGRVDRLLLTALPGGTKGIGLIGIVYADVLSIFVVADRSLAAVADGVCKGAQEWFDALAKAVAEVGAPV